MGHPPESWDNAVIAMCMDAPLSRLAEIHSRTESETPGDFSKCDLHLTYSETKDYIYASGAQA
jgi:hypothetical protein